MKATEAQKISMENTKNSTMKNIFDTIKASAESGMFHAIMHLTEAQIIRLRQLGYRVSESPSPQYGVTSSSTFYNLPSSPDMKISWGSDINLIF